MPDREPMQSIDTAWLRMERPTNLMMLCGVMIFETKLDFGRFKKAIETRLLCQKRFSQRIVEQSGAAFWEIDQDFDLSAHVHRTALPAPAGRAELQGLVSDLIGTPLDRSKPLWQFHVVEDYGGGTAVIVRIHHCYADGIALMRVLLSMADCTSDKAPRRAETAAGNEELDFWVRLFAPVTETRAFKLGSSLLLGYLDLLVHPAQALEYARQGLGSALEATDLALMPEDSYTRFKGKLGVAKRTAWSDPMPLTLIKEVGRVLDCTVNDVLLSCVVGALRSYLLEQADAVDGVEIRAIVPVNLRPASEEDLASLGNYFGLVALLLPVGMENPVERLYEMKRRMQALKHSHQPILTLGLLSALGRGPKALQQRVLDMLASKATVVMTNVPGPRETLYLAGARLAQIMFWVPQSGDIGMGVSILSYNGSVQFGLVTDRKLMSEPENIVNRLAPEFEKLLLIILMAPWDGPPDAKEMEASLSRLVR